MDILHWLNDGIQTVQNSITIFKNQKQDSNNFVQPFILCKGKRKNEKVIQLSEISETCVKLSIEKFSTIPDYLVLSGETTVENPKTHELQYFYVVKLYFKGAPQGYIYSIPFTPAIDGGELSFGHVRYVGSDDNLYLPHSILHGESSSCNVIKMDPEPPYEYRAAFLIGHMDEARLWIDVSSVVTDMFCKLALDLSRQYELIFEISKFGAMTKTMQTQFDVFNEYASTDIFPKYAHIKAHLQLENKRLV